MTNNNDTETSTSKKFRSVLPHEPLPGSNDYNNADNIDNIGHVHLQGALEPKKIKPKDSKNNNNDNDNKDKDDNNSNNNNNNASDLYYWTSKETLETALTKALCSSSSSSSPSSSSYLNDNKNNDNNNQLDFYQQSLQLPYPAISVQVLDPVPPFTKVRLTYATPQQAQTIVAAWRRLKLSPAHLFDDHQNDNNNYNNNNNSRPDSDTTTTNDADTANDTSTIQKYKFGSHACQVTMITTIPLPENSWTRSNPPKFRRLLHDHIDMEERSNTRFVYVTGLVAVVTVAQQQQQQQSEQITTTMTTTITKDASNFWTIAQKQQYFHIIMDSIRQVFNQYDSSKLGVEIFISKKQQQHSLPTSCHIGMRTPEDAQHVISTLQGKTVLWKHPYNNNDNNSSSSNDINHDDNDTFVESAPLFLDYASVTQRSLQKSKARDNNNNHENEEDAKFRGEPSRPECTSTTNHITIPGLMVIPDFVSEAEEQVLMATLTGPYAPWAPDQMNKSQTGAVKRLVQHYGYVFDYQTANVLRNRQDYERGANCPTMPALFVEKLDKKDDYSNNEEKEVENNTTAAATATTSGSNTKNNLVDVSVEGVKPHVQNGQGWDVLAAIIERTRRFEFKLDEDSNNDDHSADATKTLTTTTATATTTTTTAEKTTTRSTMTAKSTVSYPSLNQLTLNHYKPGEGIGSHVDTPSAFGDGLLSLSLNSGIVMEFRKVTSEDNNNDEETTATSTSTTTLNAAANITDTKIVKKLVYLPPRSLVLMSGDARYKWEHMIVTRRTDTVDGTVIPRDLRVSLTFRTALDVNGMPLPLVESRDFPPIWNRDRENETNRENSSTTATTTTTTGIKKKNALITPETEREHVHAVYDAIATQWHHTRGKRGVLWPGARQFLERLPPGSIVADVGCGDGKYFPAILEAGSYVIGTDISMPLLQTAFGNTNTKTTKSNKKKGQNDEPDKEEEEEDNVVVVEEKIADACKVSGKHRESLRNRPAVAVADCMSLPMRNDSCDAAICIAVMHHLSTLERRIRCVEELVRIVRNGGTINIQAWALDQDENSRRRFASTDVFVPFNAQPKYLEKVMNDDNNYDTDNNATTATKESLDPPKATTSTTTTTATKTTKSVAEMYSEKYKKADFDEKKGLVIFQRYCHMYRKGELEEIVQQVPGAVLLESGYESGNYFVILKVERE